MRHTRPKLTGYSDQPRTHFQERCAAYVEPYMSFANRNEDSPWRFAFYRMNDQQAAEVVQLFRRDWTLHVQVVLHGNEENLIGFQRLGLTKNSVLISLDVERGPSADAVYTTEAVNKIRRLVRDGINHRYPHGLAPAEPYRFGHHVIVEIVPYEPVEQFFVYAAARMIAYCETIYPVAADILGI